MFIFIYQQVIWVYKFQVEKEGKSSNIATYSKRGGDCMVGNYILLDHFGDSNVPNSVHGYE
jgi:hypothetical protein